MMTMNFTEQTRALAYHKESYTLGSVPDTEVKPTWVCRDCGLSNDATLTGCLYCGTQNNAEVKCARCGHGKDKHTVDAPTDYIGCTECACSEFDAGVKNGQS